MAKFIDLVGIIGVKNDHNGFIDIHQISKLSEVESQHDVFDWVSNKAQKKPGCNERCLL